ncbi:hypothetical protein EFV37_29305 [Mesorhizobium loti]|uniref:Uncharacterized protein n=1 Tax=Mesorhizobium jarvisii TaxID=1777867 RepID=A0A6M7TLS5_9HYPH|nr:MULTISPECIES: hypothetical protein [Mesorhizobium]OBQ68937.1 hypothetical protein A9K72_12160 [Mesorhizobium loti]QKC65901.1 hypothetical protein EB229_29295 [Mesorhizobium jarvisii]QKD11815.1 hypothetical protein EFV37_29305 [Mesorhizobium loti]RJT37922.1 hypothetical protein D3242_01350 [Mesorhizobium jarvisii]
MTKWMSIETAPKDGSTVHVKRVYEGAIIYEGPAVWRTVRFGSLADPITGKTFAEVEDATGWMRIDSEHRVPEPTHWRES